MKILALFFFKMLTNWQERAVGDDWRVAEAAGWDFGGQQSHHLGREQPTKTNFLENGSLVDQIPCNATKANTFGRTKPPCGLWGTLF